MKPLNRKNYGSIPHLSNSKLGEKDYFIGEGQERILTQKKRDKHDTILVYEKYDGSNVGIAKVDGKIFALTRSGYEAKTSKYKLHHDFHMWVKEKETLFDLILSNGERIAGEWMGTAIGMLYDIKQEPIVFFDFFDSQNNRLTHDYLHFFNKCTNLPIARIIHKGDAISVDELKPILNLKTDSIWSKEDPEGMIYRVERKDKVDFLAKWVRSDFDNGKYIINKKDEELIKNT